MNKKTAIMLGIAAAVIAVGYVLYRWYQANAASTGGTGSLGSNLNSVAPELVGGSAGPSVGPALSAPVNITLNETSTGQMGSVEPPANPGGPVMASPQGQSTNALTQQSQAAQAGVMDAGGQDVTIDRGGNVNAGGTNRLMPPIYGS